VATSFCFRLYVSHGAQDAQAARLHAAGAAVYNSTFHAGMPGSTGRASTGFAIRVVK
jgi:hypothetical protein